MIIELGNTLVSTEIFTKQFVCDLNACKGACCIEGDRGAPLELSEIGEIEQALDAIKPYMTSDGIALLESEGFHEGLEIDDPATTCLPGGECVFAYRDEKGILGCAVEKAHSNGKSPVNKPISCHLYPIRIGKIGQMETLNYHEWHICKAACALGDKLKQPLYRFVKGPLIRRYGENWYSELELIHTEFIRSFPDNR